MFLDGGFRQMFVTYNMIIDGLCKGEAVDWVEGVLQQTID